ncbi:hypothetical protein BG006_009624 [Podila minutissima]|uniref:BZIP domain-containing protein n=1 Tax=Podila minutissima TaxID=64525 RepID=A0A9P5VPY2_9FUNG|nr:hypothetical protein BG006_009624 [Podila minutissima]
MSDNSLLSLIASLNSESPVQASSPEDYTAELSLWTNAEFTFDVPPGLGIFEGDSGFESFTDTTTDTTPSTASSITESISTPTTTTTTLTDAITPTLDFLNLPQSLPEPRPLSLLERTRQRNPVSVEEPRALHEQVAAVNSFHSLLAAYSASAQLKQLQQEQQNILSRLANTPLSAPTTPAAAKLLRQPMPQYKEPTTKRQKTSTTLPTPVTVPSSPMTVLESTPSAQDIGDGYELSAADSFSKDDPEYLTKVAVEEDKRRRNTAASARFRQKKKLREQALEQTAREQTQRAEGLEARVKELEMEVRWLRGLIVEKDSRLHEAALTLQNQGIRL